MLTLKRIFTILITTTCIWTFMGLNTSQAQLGTQSSATIKGVLGSAWSKDGTLLATASSDGQIKIYRSDKTLLTSFQAFDSNAIGVAWSPDAHLLATTALSSPYIRIWDVATSTIVREIQGFTEGVYNIAWQPSGKYLVASGFDTFQAWNTETWKPITQGLSVTLLDIKWSADGSRFAFAGISRIGTGVIIDDKVQVTTFDVIQEGFVLGVNWSPDGTQIVSAGGASGRVVIWDSRTGQQLANYRQTDQVITDASFTQQDGLQVTAISEAGWIYTINTLTSQILQTQAQNAYLWSLAWDKNTQKLAITGAQHQPDQETRPQTDNSSIITLGASIEFLELLPTAQK